MPPKQVISGFDKRWREYLKRVSKRVESSITAVGTRITDITIEELGDEAPWTGGGLLNREKYPSAKFTGHKPVTPSGFVRFRRETRGVRTFVIRNVMWPIYGEALDDGRVEHNPKLGGRQWEPGFVARSIQNAKARYATE